MTQPTRVRLDRWLWAARFFKTRALAAAQVRYEDWLRFALPLLLALLALGAAAIGLGVALGLQ